ncbi:hypothetical protein EDB81DRAFT_107766 [Dactylonectria macrodidyma]|uniref:Uncharacterized protein n=1 Tax=Dactylonectria macrodidyma TaxID=307937 RepID=A0A9P9IWV5_9HYPO|nr:hypothetical protein EDB81DRAFT_107766 [Dactylonectria macrodidyma]
MKESNPERIRGVEESLCRQLSHRCLRVRSNRYSSLPYCGSSKSSVANLVQALWRRSSLKPCARSTQVPAAGPPSPRRFTPTPRGNGQIRPHQRSQEWKGRGGRREGEVRERSPQPQTTPPPGPPSRRHPSNPRLNPSVPIAISIWVPAHAQLPAARNVSLLENLNLRTDRVERREIHTHASDIRASDTHTERRNAAGSTAPSSHPPSSGPSMPSQPCIAIPSRRHASTIKGNTLLK